MPKAYDIKRDDGIGYSYAYECVGRLNLVCDPEGNEINYYEYNG
jgi:hypothetical protein